MASLRATRPLLARSAGGLASRGRSSQAEEQKAVKPTKYGVQGTAHLIQWKGDPVDKKPMKVSVEAGKTYVWCACGNSRRQPWCDGSHTKTAISVRPVPFIPEKSGTVFMCQCKQTANKPFCDGSHRKMPAGPINDRINDMPIYYEFETDKAGSVAYRLGFRTKAGMVTHKYNRI